MTKNQGHAHQICRQYAAPFVKRPYQHIVEVMPESPDIHNMMHQCCYALDAPRALPNGGRD